MMHGPWVSLVECAVAVPVLARVAWIIDRWLDALARQGRRT